MNIAGAGAELDVFGRELRGMLVAAGVGHGEDLVPERLAEAGEAQRLDLRDERLLEIRLWVATPDGQRSVWHLWAWMQPIESIASRAMLIMSAPRPKATIARSGKPSLPDAIQTTRSAIFSSRNAR